MNLVEHTPASLTLLESGALYLMTFSKHIVRLIENLKNDTASWMQSKQWRISTIFDDCDADRLKECIVQWGYATFTELPSTVRGVSYSLVCKIIRPIEKCFLGGKGEDLTPGHTMN